MGIISVDSAGLAWLGTECDKRAAVVIGGCAAPAVSGGLWATSAAVRAVHGDVGEATQLIADRLRSTGQKRRPCGDRLAATEVHNLIRLTRPASRRFRGLMVPAKVAPSLSDVRTFTGDDLIDAAQHWSDSATAMDGNLSTV